MWLGVILLTEFLLAVTVFVVMRMAIAYHYKNLGKAEWQFRYFIDTHTIRIINNGPFVEFIEKLQKQHRIPQIKLFSFTPKDGLASIQKLLPLPEPPAGPFAYIPEWGFAKFSIFLPQQWLDSGLSEGAIKLSICHESGHIIYRRRGILWGLFYYIRGKFSRRFSSACFDEKLYEKKDSWANAFSAKVMGKEKTIQLLEEIRQNAKYDNQPLDQYQTKDIDHHIADIKESIQQQHPLRLS